MFDTSYIEINCSTVAHQLSSFYDYMSNVLSTLSLFFLTNKLRQRLALHRRMFLHSGTFLAMARNVLSQQFL